MTKTDFNTWLEELNNKRRDYWNTNYTHREYTPIQVQEGKKYIKLISDSSVWGFVSKVNGILKDEFYLDKTFDNLTHAKRAAKNAIQLYNEIRLHLSLDYKTPNMVYLKTA